jgi:hypothetical protein
VRVPHYVPREAADIELSTGPALCSGPPIGTGLIVRVPYYVGLRKEGDVSAGTPSSAERARREHRHPQSVDTQKSLPPLTH